MAKTEHNTVIGKLFKITSIFRMTTLLEARQEYSDHLFISRCDVATSVGTRASYETTDII